MGGWEPLTTNIPYYSAGGTLGVQEAHKSLLSNGLRQLPSSPISPKMAGQIPLIRQSFTDRSVLTKSDYQLSDFPDQRETQPNRSRFVMTPGPAGGTHSLI